MKARASIYVAGVYLGIYPRMEFSFDRHEDVGWRVSVGCFTLSYVH